MRRIVTDRGAWSVMIVSLAEMAEPLEVLFGMWTWVGPRNPVLDWHAHWRHLANRVKLSVCDVALRQITLTTCYYCHVEHRRLLVFSALTLLVGRQELHQACKN